MTKGVERPLFEQCWVMSGISCSKAHLVITQSDTRTSAELVFHSPVLVHRRTEAFGTLRQAADIETAFTRDLHTDGTPGFGHRKAGKIQPRLRPIQALELIEDVTARHLQTAMVIFDLLVSLRIGLIYSSIRPSYLSVVDGSLRSGRMRQEILAEEGFERSRKLPRRERFLEERNRIIP